MILVCDLPPQVFNWSTGRTSRDFRGAEECHLPGADAKGNQLHYQHPGRDTPSTELELRNACVLVSVFTDCTVSKSEV